MDRTSLHRLRPGENEWLHLLFEEIDSAPVKVRERLPAGDRAESIGERFGCQESFSGIESFSGLFCAADEHRF